MGNFETNGAPYQLNLSLSRLEQVVLDMDV